MNITQLQKEIPDTIFEIMQSQQRTQLRPAQYKAIQKGLFSFTNQLICTPTGSGKTYVAELAFLHSILSNTGKAIYVVPLKALANEKYHEFTAKYGSLFRIARSLGDSDSSEDYLSEYDLILTTSEKLDSLMRHHAKWIKDVKVVIIDEIHQLNDPNRGPTLEIVITILRNMLSKIQLIGLSATIGNSQTLANWLEATLIEDSWRPTKLHKGIYEDGKITFFEEK